MSIDADAPGKGPIEVLWLSEQAVKSALTMPEALDVVEEAFREHGMGRTQMPPKSYLYYPEGDLRTMPAFLNQATGVKIVNVHPKNPEKGLPTVMALVVLNSVQTGAPLAVMGATHLTAVRTGAAGGIAAKYMARPDSRRLGIIGAGAQARTQMAALARLFALEEVRAYDISPERCRALASEARDLLKARIVECRSAEEACDCDILVTATPSRTPVVREAWILPGTHINAIGADAKGKEELEPAILRKARVVVDDMVQAIHSGEVNVPISKGQYLPEDIHAELGEIVTKKKSGRQSREEITIFDSTGLAILDIAAASLVLQRAVQRGLGQNMPFLAGIG
ncbi:MAG TPA: alanine dehydrogenase [Methanotrichaceae archaeon]|nr:MAG: Alanine dehydrogenase [Methanosaeta sp. PtaU1.Bin028]HOT06040.1 alanine dehydrogenase [Methanotrichaceae archaeon]HQF16310.1 alanine dehydrogenase [Methanotrichaceae archaeon]HQI90082.1 alanine dehydrogenase [Methanotrichaceae archaeon]HQJ27895.1 alanine dehydrogenase [Methanotrichaceae archaeon]